MTPMCGFCGAALGASVPGPEHVAAIIERVLHETGACVHCAWCGHARELPGELASGERVCAGCTREAVS